MLKINKEPYVLVCTPARLMNKKPKRLKKK
jgi:hypothetical protein